ncbi:hypothetical protein BGW80DRAFT_233099 [Lactifluus volemus]|nr:hypothetical protein BGW80DRAFT_233099 [Lactifluus volemus]
MALCGPLFYQHPSTSFVFRFAFLIHTPSRIPLPSAFSQDPGLLVPYYIVPSAVLLRCHVIRDHLLYHRIHPKLCFVASITVISQILVISVPRPDLYININFSFCHAARLCHTLLYTALMVAKRSASSEYWLVARGFTQVTV